MINMTYEELKDSKYVLFKSIRGSHLFGLETEKSDLDTYSVFCAPQDWLYGTGRDYMKVVGDEKSDNVIYELNKYFQELGKSNPDALMSLFTPGDKILYLNPLLHPLFNMKEELLTKECFKSFRGYAKSQIGKAKGLNKAMNIDPKEVKTRKSPLDFCWITSEDNMTLGSWLEKNGLKQEHCGLVKLPGGVELYCLHYDWFADKTLDVKDYARLRYGTEVTEDIRKELEEGKKTQEIRYRGIIKPDSDQLRLSWVSKESSLTVFQYNSNAFITHCRKYREYHEWVANRNPVRYEENKEKSYDAKNCSHCLRILTMAKEIALGKGMILDRRKAGDRDLLLDIKQHRYSYDEVMQFIVKAEKEMEEAFLLSTLPESPDVDKLEEILIRIRKVFYKKYSGKR